MNIFLDDVRMPKDCVSYMSARVNGYSSIYTTEKWTIVRNYDEFVEAIKYNAGQIHHISFDHDLADEHVQDLLSNKNFDKKDSEITLNYESYREKTGYDCAKWFLEYYMENNLTLPLMLVHSLNPVGTQNIISLFKNTK